jgi:FixJ family two-component response regulator
VPFLFATGYGDSRMIAERFRWVPVVRKPYNVASLVCGVEAAMRTRAEPQPAAE